MVTFVGTQTKLVDALKDLMELDYDAKEAYEAAINRLDNEDYRSTLTQFKADHQRHIEEISELLKEKGEEIPSSPNIKQWLTQGKVVLANLIGDNTILRAMKSNEEDTNSAYERMAERDDLWPEAKILIERGLADERRHMEWIQTTLDND